MPLIQWNDRFSVGVPSLDRQHRQLIDIVNELHDAMTAGRGQDVIRTLLDRLSSYAKTHLETEEKMLQAYAYPGFAAHKAQHEAYLKRVRDLQAQSCQGRLTMTLTLMNFLKDWWSNHILHADMEYAPFLKAHKAA